MQQDTVGITKILYVAQNLPHGLKIKYQYLPQRVLYSKAKFSEIFEAQNTAVFLHTTGNTTGWCIINLLYLNSIFLPHQGGSRPLTIKHEYNKN